MDKAVNRTGSENVSCTVSGAAAIIVPSFVPKNIPALNLVYSQIVLGDDVVAAGGAANEVVMLHCPE